MTGWYIANFSGQLKNYHYAEFLWFDVREAGLASTVSFDMSGFYLTISSKSYNRSYSEGISSFLAEGS